MVYSLTLITTKEEEREREREREIEREKGVGQGNKPRPGRMVSLVLLHLQTLRLSSRTQ